MLNWGTRQEKTPFLGTLHDYLVFSAKVCSVSIDHPPLTCLVRMMVSSSDLGADEQLVSVKKFIIVFLLEC